MDILHTQYKEVDIHIIELEVTHMERGHLCISQCNFMYYTWCTRGSQAIMSSIIKQMAMKFSPVLFNSGLPFFILH